MGTPSMWFLAFKDVQMALNALTIAAFIALKI